MEGVLKSIISLTGAQSRNPQAQSEFSAKLISDIEEVSNALNNINSKYNLTNDSDLIDSLIYQELSLRARYSYLLRLARDHNVHYQGNFISER